jgi:hypothetical protein
MSFSVRRQSLLTGFIKPELSDFHNKASRTGVSPVLKGEMLGQPGRLSYRGLGFFVDKKGDFLFKEIWLYI